MNGGFQPVVVEQILAQFRKAEIDLFTTRHKPIVRYDCLRHLRMLYSWEWMHWCMHVPWQGKLLQALPLLSPTPTLLEKVSLEQLWVNLWLKTMVPRDDSNVGRPNMEVPIFGGSVTGGGGDTLPTLGLSRPCSFYKDRLRQDGLNSFTPFKSY